MLSTWNKWAEKFRYELAVPNKTECAWSSRQDRRSIHWGCWKFLRGRERTRRSHTCLTSPTWELQFNPLEKNSHKASLPPFHRHLSSSKQRRKAYLTSPQSLSYTRAHTHITKLLYMTIQMNAWPYMANKKKTRVRNMFRRPLFQLWVYFSNGKHIRSMRCVSTLDVYVFTGLTLSTGCYRCLEA